MKKNGPINVVALPLDKANMISDEEDIENNLDDRILMNIRICQNLWSLDKSVPKFVC